MTRPQGILPRWATDDVYTSGPDDTLATKIEPLAGEKAQGYKRGYRPPARKLNWIINRLSAWIGYTADFNAANWYAWEVADRLGVPFDIDAFRPDGTVRAIYSETFAQWILPGRDTLAGTIWIGEHGFWTPAATATSFPHKLQIAVESGGRVSCFPAATFTGAPPYVYSGALTLTAWTASSLPVANPAADYAIADAAQLSTGRILVCGSGDTNNLVWYSDDGGVTFTGPIQINFLSVGSYCTRVVPGPGNQVVVLGTGSHLWQSNDAGVTWSERDLTPHGVIKFGVYLPGFDLWCFATASTILSTQEPATDAFVSLSLGSAVTLGMASHGDAVLIIMELGGYLGQNLFLSRDAFTGPMVRVGRLAWGSPSNPPVAFAASNSGQFLMATKAQVRTSLRGVE